jgi:hypothetical protein
MGGEQEDIKMAMGNLTKGGRGGFMCRVKP